MEKVFESENGVKYTEWRGVYLPVSVKEEVVAYIEAGAESARGIILYGDTSVGKSTLAKEIAKEITGVTQEISDMLSTISIRSAATLTGEKKATSNLFPSNTIMPVVNIIDEAQAFTPLEFQRLLAPLEEKTKNKVIMTTTNIEKMNEAVMMRCKRICMTSLPDDAKEFFNLPVNMRVLDGASELGEGTKEVAELIINYREVRDPEEMMSLMSNSTVNFKKAITIAFNEITVEDSSKIKCFEDIAFHFDIDLAKIQVCLLINKLRG